MMNNDKMRGHLYYMAGFFDGEGWVTIVKGKPRTINHNPQYYLRIGVENVNIEVLKFLQMKFGGNIYRRPKRRAENRRLTGVWYLDANNALSFLLLIKNYLIVKRKQAALAVRFQSHINKYNYGKRKWGKLSAETLEFREKNYQQLKILNGIFV